MRSAAVSTLKATLSACLARVKAGEEVIVMERGKPIAKLVPLPRRGEQESAHLRDLTRAGLVRPGSGQLPTGFWKMRRPRDRRGQAVRALISERAEGR
jgi:prevent-host-death family protein